MKHYFVGNAHLDPVWMWRWQEGSAEAKATIRSALDRMKEYPDFIFVCSSASVYRWVEDFDPEMFEEVKARVNEGRFIIVGGWHTQPDCNIPSGEGFARQSLYSQRYFLEKLGKCAEVGYCVDSFGHNGNLPQILKKSGMSRYVFMRPGPHENATVPSVFNWRAPDGTTIPTYKIYERYCNNFKSEEHMMEELGLVYSAMPEGTDSAMIFYGVGNHGGGPTKQNIEYILSAKEKHPEDEYIFSTVTDYFDYIENSGKPLPVYENDLQHHASGCYSAVSLIKSLIRKSENELLTAEVTNFMAASLIGRKYETGKIAEAWQNVLFSHFHDIAGGCSLETAYTDAQYMLGESISIAEKIKNASLQSVSWAIDTHDAEKGYPIVLFNTLPYDCERAVTVNQIRNLIYMITDENGNEIPMQYVHAETERTYGRRDVIFTAKIPAMGYSIYYIKGEEKKEYESTVKATDTKLENKNLLVEFEKHTGYIKRIYDKAAGKELLSGFGAVPTVIDETGHDTWSHAKNFFTREVAKFSDATVKATENGPVRATVEVKSVYNGSVITQKFSLTENSTALEVSCELDWHEKHKMLKIAYETAAEDGKAIYEIPFTHIYRPADGEEEPGYRWFGIEDENDLYAIANTNKYSFSVNGKTLYLTAVRSPYYADHGWQREDEFRYTDQGEHFFSYTFERYSKNERSRLIKAARELNTPPTIIIENNHEGKLGHIFRGIECDKENVHISTIKRSEDGCGTVIRIYEADGIDTSFTVKGDLLPAPLTKKISHYSVDTYYLADGDTEWKDVLLTELPL